MNIAEAKKQLVTLGKLTDVLAPICALKSADAIAEFLNKRHVVGVLGDTSSCPLATYVKKSIKAREVSVDGSQIEVNKSECLTIEATPAVKKFVENFDEGQYPNITKGGIKACEKAKEDSDGF